MPLDEHQLAVVLQASIDHAIELLGEHGGFLPFGALAMPDGQIDFVEVQDAGDDAPLDAIYLEIGGIVAGEARANAILGGALVANTGLPAEVQPGFERAIAVQIETAGFSRSVVVPYRPGDGAQVQLGTMIPEASEAVIFTS